MPASLDDGLAEDVDLKKTYFAIPSFHALSIPSMVDIWSRFELHVEHAELHTILN